MSTFLLIHGSWHGAWCWSRLAPLLTKRGHRVSAVDLPAHGADQTPIFRATLRSYSRRVQHATAELGEKPILVGHSMGGMAITQAAHDAPESFAALIYLCAFVPIEGESVYQLARRDGDSLVHAHSRIRPPGVCIDPSRTKAVFYNACSDGDSNWATAQLRSDPLLPLLQRLVRRKPASLPRSYIECTQDRTISIAWQREMVERGPFDRVVSMETDHSPFLSAPDELAGHLHDLTQRG